MITSSRVEFVHRWYKTRTKEEEIKVFWSRLRSSVQTTVHRYGYKKVLEESPTMNEDWSYIIRHLSTFESKEIHSLSSFKEIFSSY